MLHLMLPLVLASGSPRRREILDQMGLPYTVDAADTDETFFGAPAEAVMELSCRKAAAVAERHPDSLVLAADTLVFADKTLGKPGTPEEAARMLRTLSGSWHNVYTGVTLINMRSKRMNRAMERTRVHIVPLTDAEIDAYVATGEPLDKAGGYAIQGLGGMLIDSIDGSFTNVVGLPKSLLRRMLLDMGVARLDGEGA